MRMSSPACLPEPASSHPLLRRTPRQHFKLITPVTTRSATNGPNRTQEKFGAGRSQFAGNLHFWITPHRSGGHFGESAGTFAQIQFFHEPSAVTHAAEVADGIAATPAAKYRSAQTADRDPATITARNVAEPIASSCGFNRASSDTLSRPTPSTAFSAPAGPRSG